MCLAVPMKVVSIHGDRALALLGDTQREISLAMLPDACVGDYVIVHAGFAIQRLDETEALETLELFKQLAASGEPGEVLP